MALEKAQEQIEVEVDVQLPKKLDKEEIEENNSKIVFRVSGSYTQHLKESFCRYV